ncbi:uncharacterized protein MELLADRAFT_71629, partial [Melampsora larici-populina 98AG31]
TTYISHLLYQSSIPLPNPSYYLYFISLLFLNQITLHFLQIQTKHVCYCHPPQIHLRIAPCCILCTCYLCEKTNKRRSIISTKRYCRTNQIPIG